VVSWSDLLDVFASIAFRANRHAIDPPTLFDETLCGLPKRFRVTDTVGGCGDCAEVCAKLAKKLEAPLAGAGRADESDDVRLKLGGCGTCGRSERHNI
jgi:hypothetical protein